MVVVRRIAVTIGIVLIAIAATAAKSGCSTQCPKGQSSVSVFTGNDPNTGAPQYQDECQKN